MNDHDCLRGLFRVATIRRLEERLQAGLAPAELMARAAAAVADEAARCLRTMPARAEVALLVGPGNNGGDALLAGLDLAARGYRVRAYGVDAILTEPPRATDAAVAWQRWQPRPIEPLSTLEADAAARCRGPSRQESSQSAPRPSLLLIDGLFGIGLTRPPGLPFASLFAALQRLRSLGDRIVAIDVPSGLDADTGAVPAVIDGATTAPLAVDATVTMIGDKPGLHTGLGSEVAGRIRVATLRPGGGDAMGSSSVGGNPMGGKPANGSAPPAAGMDEVPPDGYLIDAAAAGRWLPERAIDSHKGRHGDLLIVGGRRGMQGAARLAARGAIAAGVGKVSIAVDGAAAAAQPADPTRPEIMGWPWREGGIGRFDAVVAGCGLGFEPTARRWLLAALGHAGPLVLDADALTWIAQDPALAARLKARPPAHTVLTPHPLEAARLLDGTVRVVQHDRIGAAAMLARAWGTIVVLKGSGTVVADPFDHWAINGSGGPVLATAGTGDVLAGIIGALVCQLPPARAACLGVWAHGAAGDAQAARTGSVGSPAAVFSERLPAVWAALRDGNRHGPRHENGNQA